MNDALAATEALVAALSRPQGGRATELAVAYLRLARLPEFEAGTRPPPADAGNHPIREVLDELSDPQRSLLREAIDTLLAEQQESQAAEAPTR